MNYKPTKKHYLLFLMLAILPVACKKKTEQPHQLIERLITTYPNPLNNYELIDIDCEETQNILIQIFIDDQDVRHLGTRSMEEVDAENLQKFVSLVEKCGFPTKNDLKDYRSKYAVFLMLQHSSPKWIAHYYEDFKKAAMAGTFEKELLAYLQDRFLMVQDKPQIYGTQLQNGHLYKLSDPENVEKRRNIMNFRESLETYLKRQGLDAETEIARQLEK